MPLHVVLHLAIWVLLIGTTWEQSVKPPGLDLHRGGGHQPLFGPMERYLPMLALTCAR
jgi:hypothetical protein